MMLLGPPDMPLPSTAASALALLVVALSACKRSSPPPPVSLDVVPKARFSPERAHAGHPVAVTYRWEVRAPLEPTQKTHLAFVHFVASDGAVVLTDDHVPQPPPASWERGAVYEYTRLVFTHQQFPGPLEVRLGLYDPADGSRVGLQGAHLGQGAYRVGQLDVDRRLPEQRTLFYAGFDAPGTSDAQPFESLRPMGRDGLIACRNPRIPAVFFLHASADMEAFASPPTLQLAVGRLVRKHVLATPGRFTVVLPLDAGGVGTEEFTDVRLTLSETFQPTPGGRALGLHVHRAVLVPTGDVTPEMLSAVTVL